MRKSRAHLVIQVQIKYQEVPEGIHYHEYISGYIRNFTTYFTDTFIIILILIHEKTDKTALFVLHIVVSFLTDLAASSGLFGHAFFNI